MAGPSSARMHYVPDGSMNGSWWLGSLVTAVLAAAAGGTALDWLLVRGWYLVILVPGAVAAVVGLMVAAAVALGHCRSPLRAGLVGALGGVLMFLGSFYFAMVRGLPPGNAHRVDLLPSYIAARMGTDVERAIGPRAARRGPARPNAAGNWIRFALELSVAGLIAATPPFLRARRPYVAELGRWMTPEERRMPVGMRAEFVHAFEAGGLAEFAARLAANRAAKLQANVARHYASCTVEYVRQPGISPLEHPVYLTFIDDAANGFSALLGRDRALRQIRLKPKEVLALRPLFPNLDRILTAFQAGEAKAGAPPMREEGRPVASGTQASIRDVPGGGTLRTKGFLLTVNLVGLLPLVFFFGGMVAMGVGAWGWWRGWGMATYLGLLLGGGASFVLSAFYSQNYSSLLETWFATRRLRAILELRPDAIVSVNDSEAEVVNLTHREDWAAAKVNLIDDSGLLHLDAPGRELRIEGDKRRYRIPLTAIAECGTECFHHPLDKQMLKQFWYVRLRTNADGKPRELLFSLNLCGKRTNEARRESVRAFCRRLQRLGVPTSAG